MMNNSFWWQSLGLRSCRALIVFVVALWTMASASVAQDLSILGVELTQAMQNYDVTDPGHPDNNSNPLIAGNHTTARVYVNVMNSTGSVPGVTARISLYKNGNLHAILGPNAPGIINAPLLPDRNNEAHSLNFNLPIDLDENDAISMLIDIDPMNQIAETDESNNSREMFFSFVCRETPEIVYTPINYAAANEADPSTLGLPDPKLIEPGTGDNFNYAIFPYPDDRSQYHPGPFPPLNWNANVDSSDIQLLNTLEDCRQFINPVPKYLYGWLRENPYSGNGRAISIPGNVAFGNTQTSPDRYQRTFAHEMGHLFGLYHNTAEISPETGWDVQNLLGLGHLQPSSKSDIMRAGLLTPDAWIHDAVYDELLDYDCFECTADLGWVLHAFPYFTAEIWSRGRGLINPGFQVARNAEPTVGIEDAPYSFRALDRYGRILEEIGVFPNFEGENGEVYDSAAASVTFKTIEGIETVELLEGRRVLDRMSRTPNSPELKILSPRKGEVLGESFEVSWDAADADRDTLSYVVQYSWGYDREGRQLWVPLGVQLDEPRLKVITEGLAGTGDGTIRVLASDGMNTTVAEVTGLYLANTSAPRLSVVGQAAGEFGARKLSSVKPGIPGAIKSYLEGSLVVLQATAFDREDGQLPPESIVWTSNLDGELGRGETLQTSSLSVGIHHMTVTATDSAGEIVKEEISLKVQPSPLGQELKAARAELRPTLP